MPDLTKIATCSYCGTRAVLRLSGDVQHELSCRNCGALLHNMKPLKVSRSEGPKQRAKPAPAPRPSRQKPRKKRSFWAELVEEVFDEIEDLFD